MHLLAHSKHRHCDCLKHFAGDLAGHLDNAGLEPQIVARLIRLSEKVHPLCLGTDLAQPNWHAIKEQLGITIMKYVRLHAKVEDHGRPEDIEYHFTERRMAGFTNELSERVAASMEKLWSLLFHAGVPTKPKLPIH